MARPRHERNKKLPRGLRVNAKGYYSYRCPITGREYGLGYDKQDAIIQAREVLLRLPTTSAQRRRKQHGPDYRGLLPVEQIISGSMPLGESCGVYFLIHENAVVYVGSSLDCYDRVAWHRRRGEKLFDRWFFVVCVPEARIALERKYIVVLDPKYNVVVPGNRRREGENQGIGMGINSQAIDFAA